jgi:hypothetical protein
VIALVSLATLGMELIFIPHAWTREHLRGTAPLLWVTPLTSQEILLGRIGAGLAWSVVANAPRSVFLAAAASWAVHRGFWQVLPALLAALPLLFLVPAAGRISSPTRGRAPVELGALTLSSLWVLAVLGFWAAARVVNMGSVAMWIGGMGLALLGFIPCRLVYDMQRVWLECVRTGKD